MRQAGSSPRRWTIRFRCRGDWGCACICCSANGANFQSVSRLKAEMLQSRAVEVVLSPPARFGIENLDLTVLLRVSGWW